MLMTLKTSALVIIIGGTSWLLFVSFLMFVQPMQFLAMLRMTAATRAINNWEQGFRLLSGIAFYVRAEVSKSPLIDLPSPGGRGRATCGLRRGGSETIIALTERAYRAWQKDTCCLTGPAGLIISEKKCFMAAYGE